MVYVDDVTGYSKDCDRELRPLSSAYKVRDESKLNYHLGMNRVEQVDGSISLSSEKYFSNVLPHIERKHGIMRLYDTPMSTGDRPELDTTPLLSTEEHRQFQSLVGIGQWLVQIGRWDISFAICSLSRFSAAPREGHLERLLRIFGYLKKHPSFKVIIDSASLQLEGIEYFNWDDPLLSLYGSAPDEDFIKSDGTSLQLTAFVDADHAHDCQISRSVSGYIIFLGSTPVSWKSSRQKVVATSTFASELLALKQCVEEVLNIRATVMSLGATIYNSTATILVDNRSVLLATKPGNELKKKHLAVAYNFVREATAHG
ncbi:MAG: Ty1/Copia family ribonuclease HI, partial [Bacteroidota bacterium]